MSRDHFIWRIRQFRFSIPLLGRCRASSSANIWQMLGFYMIIILTGLQTIPANLYEAAEIDGANSFRRLLRITLPLLKPSLFLCFVIGMLNSVTSFDLIYVMTNGGPATPPKSS